MRILLVEDEEYMAQAVVYFEGSAPPARGNCLGRNVINSKRRGENDPIAGIVNAGILSSGYGSAGISAGGAVKCLSPRQVADLLGHTTSEITELYYVKKDTARLNGITDAFEM